MKDVKIMPSGNEPVKFVYVCFDTRACQGEEALPSFKINLSLNFTITEIDVETEDEVGSYEEDYTLPETVVKNSDYIKGQYIPAGAWMQKWNEFGANEETCAHVEQNYQLPFKTMDEAIEGLIKNFGMSVSEDSDKHDITDKVHNLLLSGVFLGREHVVVRCMIGFNQEYGCVLKLFVRSSNKMATAFMLRCIN